MIFDITDIKRIVAKPGDVLLIRMPASCDRVEVFNEIYESFSKAFPNVTIMVTTDEWDVTAINAKEALAKGAVPLEEFRVETPGDDINDPRMANAPRT